MRSGKTHARRRRATAIGEARREAVNAAITKNEQPVLGHPKGLTVTVAPHQQAIVQLPPEPSMVLIYDLIPQGDNSYKAVARARDRYVRMSRKTLRKLGIGVDYRVLRRLGQAGFIQILRPAPNVYLLNLTSYYEHLRECEADEEFWDRVVDVRDPGGRLRGITNAQRYREGALLCKH